MIIILSVVLLTSSVSDLTLVYLRLSNVSIAFCYYTFHQWQQVRLEVVRYGDSSYQSQSKRRREKEKKRPVGSPDDCDEMCRGSKAILTLDRCRQTELRSETEQVMSTTEDEDHTGTPVRERELEYQGNTSILLIQCPQKLFKCFGHFGWIACI